MAAESHLILRIDQTTDFEPDAMREKHEKRLEQFRRKATEEGANSESARILKMLEDEARRPREPFTTEQTILYRPELDVPIDDDVFAFEPPA